MRKCPKCGSKNVIPIMYGMPAWDEELEKNLKEHKIILGGCCITECVPKYYCNSCKKKICSPPVLSGKNGIEDYRDIVTEITFSDGGFFSGYEDYRLRKQPNGGCLFDYQPDFRCDGEAIHTELPEKEWKQLVEKLYGKLCLHEWKKKYVNLGVLDGEEWSLSLKLTGGRERNYVGCNAYPPLWRELRNTFLSLRKRYQTIGNSSDEEGGNA